VNIPTMKCEWWKNVGYFEGGCWCLVLGNNHLFAVASQKGRHPLTRIRLEKLALMWNASRGAEMLEKEISR